MEERWGCGSRGSGGDNVIRLLRSWWVVTCFAVVAISAVTRAADGDVTTTTEKSEENRGSGWLLEDKMSMGGCIGEVYAIHGRWYSDLAQAPPYSTCEETAIASSLWHISETPVYPTNTGVLSLGFVDINTCTSSPETFTEFWWHSFECVIGEQGTCGHEGYSYVFYCPGDPDECHSCTVQGTLIGHCVENPTKGHTQFILGMPCDYTLTGEEEESPSSDGTEGDEELVWEMFEYYSSTGCQGSISYAYKLVPFDQCSEKGCSNTGVGSLKLHCRENLDLPPNGIFFSTYSEEDCSGVQAGFWKPERCELGTSTLFLCDHNRLMISQCKAGCMAPCELISTPVPVYSCATNGSISAKLESCIHNTDLDVDPSSSSNWGWTVLVFIVVAAITALICILAYKNYNRHRYKTLS
ncbi:hypothetical protein Pelo_1775 [Pelomyxa schiedti]|nr:hypothetical protein Pelo_1775 [Pelomyxa schiedti]